MTIVTALKYEGGVVIATDSQASDLFAHVRWEVNKARQVKDLPLVVAFSGSTGRAEEAHRVLSEAQWHQNMFRKPDLVRDAIGRCLKPIYQDIKQRNQYAPSNSLWEISLHGLVAYWAADAPHIIEYELNGDDSFHNVFHAVGSGSATAYAIFRTLGGSELVSLSEANAILGMLRILRTSVGVEMWGVSDPFSLWIVNRNGTREMGRHEVQAHMQYVDQWEERERRAFLES